MMHILFTVVTLVVAAVADYGGNLNYRSPSINHPALGIDVLKVRKRQIGGQHSGGSHNGGRYNGGQHRGNGIQHYGPQSGDAQATSTQDPAPQPSDVQDSTWDPNQLNFTHGIASGDPYPNSIILWTRVAPMLANDRSNVTVEGTVPLYNHDTEGYILASSNPICVDWAVYSSRLGNDSAAITSGRAYTTSDIDYTVKVISLQSS